MKLAIVIGHNARKMGAFAVAPISMYEYEFWDTLVRETWLCSEMRVFKRVDEGSYTREVLKTYAQVDAWGADRSVELHFNDTPGATGTETLSSGTKGSLQLATPVQAAMCRLLGLKNRGIIIRKKNEKGGRSLWAGKAPAIITEPFFGNNLIDVRHVMDVGPKLLLNTIITAACQTTLH